jgi:WD40 repeat protein
VLKLDGKWEAMSSQPIAPSADDRFVAVACEQNMVEVCNLRTNEKASFRGRAVITAVAISDEGRYVAGGCWGAMVWDLQTGHLLFEENGASVVSGIAFSQDGRILAAAFEREVHVYHLDKSGHGLLVQRLAGHDSKIRSMATSEDGSRIATTSFGGELVLWDADRGQRLTTLLLDAPAWCVAMKRDKIVCGDQRGQFSFSRC